MKRSGLVCYSVVFILLLLVGSCKTHKKAAKKDAGILESHTVFFNKMQESAFAFETLSAKLNVDLDIPGKNVSSRVDLKMIKDQAFQLSVQPFLGIEIFRAEISVDSIKIIDRMNKRYVAESYSSMKGQMPIDFNFYNLQALFTNQLFYPGEQAVTPKLYKRFSLTQESRTAEITAKDVLDLIYLFSTDEERKLVSTCITDDKERYFVIWKYSDFRLAGPQLFPMSMDIRFSEGKKLQGGLKISYSKMELNKPFPISFSIPSKYKRVTFAEIIKSISSKKK